MRKELLGPFPAAAGLLLVLVVLATPTGSQLPPCGCRIFSPQEFEAQDEAGYPAVANGTAIAIEGVLSNVNPEPLIAAPSRSFSFRGSSLVFNVSSFQAAPPFAGNWVRITAVHAGESEDTTPGGGHAWTFVGLATPADAVGYPPLGLALGVSILAWGLATVPSYRRTRAESTQLRAKLAQLRRDAEGEPAVLSTRAVMARLDAAARELRWGQQRAARESLETFEAALHRGQALGRMIEETRSALGGLTKRMGRAGPHASKLLDEAARLRAGGAVPEAEEELAAAMAELQAGGRTLDLIERVAAVAAAGADETDPSADDPAGSLRDSLANDSWLVSEEHAVAALASVLERSPVARAARNQIDAFEGAIQGDRMAGVGRDISNQLAAARSAYAAADFARASALAQAGMWVVDAESIGEPGVRRAISALWQARGWVVQEGAEAVPVGGMVATRAEERVLIVTTAWREFPTERVLLAVRDYLRSGGASRALVYSSAFANTSTDPKIAVITLREMLEELTEAAGLSAHGNAV